MTIAQLNCIRMLLNDTFKSISFLLLQKSQVTLSTNTKNDSCQINVTPNTERHSQIVVSLQPNYYLPYLNQL